MSYQMIGVRGSTAYRLYVTRATTVAALCAWLGVDRGRLLEANPDLASEELPEGIELVVPADWVATELGTDGEKGPEGRTEAPRGVDHPELARHDTREPQAPEDEGLAAARPLGRGESVKAAVEDADMTWPEPPGDGGGGAPAVPTPEPAQALTGSDRATDRAHAPVDLPAAGDLPIRQPETVADSVAPSPPPLRWRPFPKPAVK